MWRLALGAVLLLGLFALAVGTPVRGGTGEGDVGGSEATEEDRSNSEVESSREDPGRSLRLEDQERSESHAAENSPAAETSPVGVGPRDRTLRREGLVVTMTLRSGDAGGPLVAGTETEVSLRITDERSGAPIRGLHPLAWIHRRVGEVPPTPEELERTISTFLGGLVGVRADHDLNRSLLLVLNHDATISVIDPQVEFSRSKLLHLIQLSGPAEDRVIDPRGEQLFVSVPARDRVERIDLTTFEVEGFVSLGEGNDPRPLVLEPSGALLWVGLDASNAIVAIDPSTDAIVDRVPVGVGPHRLAISDDGRFLAATSGRSRRVTIVDLADRSVLASYDIGGSAYPVVWSAASRLFVVGQLDAPHLSLIDPAEAEPRPPIPLEGGVFALGVDPSGRYLFALDLEGSLVTVLDLATRTPVGVVRDVVHPDQVAWTEDFAFIRSLGSPRVAAIDLHALDRGRILLTDLPITRLPADRAGPTNSIAPQLVATPERNSVMIASPGDRLVYYYQAGMMAPMGNFQTYGRVPRGIALLDRSLRETAPGVYSTTFRPERGGTYDVPFVIDRPRLLGSFALEVRAATDPAASVEPPPIDLQYAFEGSPRTVGTTDRLRLSVLEAETRRPVVGLEDVHVLVIEGPGRRQDRHVAREVGPGIYEFEQHFPTRGRYRVLVQVPSRGGTFEELPMAVIPVLTEEERSPWERDDRPKPERPRGPR